MKKNLLTLGLLLFTFMFKAQTPRMTLYEEFTGETCPPCASTNPALNTLLASPTNTPKIIAIKWQVPIPSAPTKTWSLYQTNKVEIDWRWKSIANGGYGYSPAINSAPSSKIDGQEATVFGATSGHPANLNNNVIATAASYTSAFSISVTRAWDPTCSSVNLTVSIAATANFNAVGALKFRTVMVERLIQFSVQPGTNGETTFEDAAIKSFPTLQAGVSMAGTWVTGQTQTFTMNCTVPSYVRNKNQIAFVCFIQDDGNQRVAQAVRADKVAIPSQALAELDTKVDVTCSNSITPQVTIRNDGISAINSLTINPFTDGIAKNSTSWSGNLAVGASTSIILDPISTPTNVGAHTFSFDVTLSTPYNLTSAINKVSYLVASNYQTAPIVEDFAASNFPPTNWALCNSNSGASWSRAVPIGGYNLSPSSAKYDFFNNNSTGDVDDLFLPPSNLSGSAAPVLSFDLAYAQKNANNNDKLEVMVSDNCGVSWSSVYSQSGLNLSTALPTAISYVPFDISEWRTESVNLVGFNKANVLVKFTTTNDNGNNLYIDNVNLSQSAPLSIETINASFKNLDVFPNPSNGDVFVKINTPLTGKTKLVLMNSLGQVVYEKNTVLNAENYAVLIDTKEFASGIYHVVIYTSAGVLAKKLTLNK